MVASYDNKAEQNHWSERGRATPVANADALGRPRRSVLALGCERAMNIRAYRWSVVVLLCVVLLLGWHCIVLHRQLITASFIDLKCEDTQRAFIDGESDPKGLARHVEFLMGYYEGESQILKAGPLAKIIRRDYEQALTNAVAAFRRWTTNDLGSDPKVWVQKYGQ
jgi:hypothetical protein